MSGQTKSGLGIGGTLLLLGVAAGAYTWLWPELTQWGHGRSPINQRPADEICVTLKVNTRTSGTISTNIDWLVGMQPHDDATNESLWRHKACGKTKTIVQLMAGPVAPDFVGQTTCTIEHPDGRHPSDTSHNYDICNTKIAL